MGEILDAQTARLISLKNAEKLFSKTCLTIVTSIEEAVKKGNLDVMVQVNEYDDKARITNTFEQYGYTVKDEYSILRISWA